MRVAVERRPRWNSAIQAANRKAEELNADRNVQCAGVDELAKRSALEGLQQSRLYVAVHRRVNGRLGNVDSRAAEATLVLGTALPEPGNCNPCT